MYLAITFGIEVAEGMIHHVKFLNFYTFKLSNKSSVAIEKNFGFLV